MITKFELKRIICDELNSKPYEFTELYGSRDVDFLTPHNISDKTRKSEYKEARYLFYYFCFELFPEMKLREMSHEMGNNQHHATILHAKKKINALLERNERLKLICNNIRLKIDELTESFSSEKIKEFFKVTLKPDFKVLIEVDILTKKYQFIKMKIDSEEKIIDYAKKFAIDYISNI